MATACSKSDCMAVEMSPLVVIMKYRPVDAQFCKVGGDLRLLQGEIQVLYQEFVGRGGRYSVYSTAMRMPRFFSVVHHVVLNGCWQRLPSSDLGSMTPGNLVVDAVANDEQHLLWRAVCRTRFPDWA